MSRHKNANAVVGDTGEGLVTMEASDAKRGVDPDAYRAEVALIAEAMKTLIDAGLGANAASDVAISVYRFVSYGR